MLRGWGLRVKVGVLLMMEEIERKLVVGDVHIQTERKRRLCWWRGYMENEGL